MTNRNRIPRLETLEARDCPAPLTFQMDYYGNLRISGQIDPAGLEIVAVGANTFDISDGGIPVLTNFAVPGNISIQSGAGDDGILFDLSGGSFSGSFSANTGNGDDFVDIFGGNIDGNVSLTGVNTSITTATIIGGSFSNNNYIENLSNLFIIDDSFIGSSVNYSGGNLNDVVSFGNTAIGNSVSLRLSNGINSFDFLSGSIGGGLTVIAGSGDDPITIDGDVAGNAYINLGSGDNGYQQSGNLFSGLTLISGAGIDNVTIDTTGTIGGNAYFNLGSGDNTLLLDGGVFGSSLTYYGGVGVDDVTFGATSTTPLARVSMILGAGDDVVTLDAPDMIYLYIDFGIGIDSYTGIFTGPQYLANLP